MECGNKDKSKSWAFTKFRAAVDKELGLSDCMENASITFARIMKKILTGFVVGENGEKLEYELTPETVEFLKEGYKRSIP